ncbi:MULTISPECIES: deoxyribose-phosphate aldolase [Thermotoga]|jgi:deoxyribose-phosphate aldolase|nr:MULTISPECIES: deoxyribose-phosphate aldolase [Thermotoga]AJG41233.1 deoxyribose-phosphate aldolase [Thermotoga sp. RQ7]MDK2950164.1 deoxyribose-phosphate aldolase [Thermotoga sp.]HBF11384.1 deoxyribose-phosphate aldolase [Thermotoga neapolitana]
MLEYEIEKAIVRYRESYEFRPFREGVSLEDVRRAIEHTNLKPFATPDDIIKLCQEAKDNRLYGVCVNPCYVSIAKRELSETDVRVVTVVGFPLGANESRTKAQEATFAVESGADEIDMVLNIGMLKAREWEFVYEDIRSVVEAARGKTVKVILETCYLDLEEKIAACVISKLAGAHYVKTSTGFGPKGATPEDVHLLKWIVGEEMKVKAAGGIRTYEDAVKMMMYGADKIGTSSGHRIVMEGEEKHGG